MNVIFKNEYICRCLHHAMHGSCVVSRLERIKKTVVYNPAFCIAIADKPLMLILLPIACIYWTGVLYVTGI